MKLSRLLAITAVIALLLMGGAEAQGSLSNASPIHPASPAPSAGPPSPTPTGYRHGLCTASREGTGHLVVKSIPGEASVYVDGSLKGSTPSDRPVTLDVPVGEHNVTLWRLKYAAYNLSVCIWPTLQTYVVAILEFTPEATEPPVFEMARRVAPSPTAAPTTSVPTSEMLTGEIKVEELNLTKVVVTEEAQITQGASNDVDPGWSPDGDHIVFQRLSPGARAWAIWVMRSDGQEAVPITSGNESDMSPAWSPDGESIAYIHQYPGQQLGIWAMDKHGGRKRPLFPETPPPSGDRYLTAAWSPDGQSLLYEFSSGRTHTLETVNSTGAGRRILRPLQKGGSGWVYPSWAPDGRILFVQGCDLWEMDRNGQSPRQVTRGDCEKGMPQLSPDGKWIAYVRNQREIWLVKPDGTSEQFLVRGLSPSWSPDGGRLAFQSGDSRSSKIKVAVFAESGQLAVLSDPYSAEIYLDDQYQGWTFRDFSNVSAGPHRLVLKKAGYRDAAVNFELSPGKRVIVSKVLEPVSGLSRTSTSRAPLAVPSGGASVSPFWRTPPSISLTSSRTSVPVGEDALLTLSIINPNANDWDVQVDAIIKVPSGVSVEGTSFVVAGSNQMLGTFTTGLGQEDHIAIRVRANEPGQKVVESQLIYFPRNSSQAHKEEVRTLQSTHAIAFTSSGAPSPGTPRATPGLDALSAVIAFVGFAMLYRRRNRNR